MYFDFDISSYEKQTKHVKQQLGQMLRNNTTTKQIHNATSADQNTSHTSSRRDVVYEKDNGDKEDEADEKQGQPMRNGQNERNVSL